MTTQTEAERLADALDCYEHIGMSKAAAELRRLVSLVSFNQQLMDEVDRLKNALAEQPAQQEPLPKGEWPKHPSPYVNDEYRGYLKSDLDDYAMHVLEIHGIKENT